MAGPCAVRGPTRAPDSGDDTSFRIVTLTHMTTSIKVWFAGLSVVVFPAQRSSSANSAFITNSPADSAFFTASSLTPLTHLILSAFLHPLLRTLPSSTHWLLTPPKVLPSCRTVAPHSLDRCLAAQSATKQETTRQLSGRYHQADRPPQNILVAWSVNRARY